MGEKRSEEFVLSEDPYYRMSQISMDNYEIEYWDVNETISELSYLTHGYFRYYGKFPSKIGKLIMQDLDTRHLISKDRDIVLDNYAGSGTSLVEAKLKGYDSFGIDINPFAVLACKVKTRNYNMNVLNTYWSTLQCEIVAYNQAMSRVAEPILTFASVDPTVKKAIIEEKELFYASNKDAEKWFDSETVTGLALIKRLLLIRPASIEREFFELAFFAIIRRVSTAYDGEVRPHVNRKKRRRDVLDAYIKKVTEMLNQMDEWNHATSNNTISDAVLCSNTDANNIQHIIDALQHRTGKQLGLVISHPPYLNCFDYISVYKLKFMWARGFDDIFYGYNISQIKNMEIRSYPANSTKKIEKYFKHNEEVYQIVFDQLRKNGYCCVVIGDCTIKNKLFPVHKTFITLLEKIGFVTEKVVYRSTSYGIGQYAYRFRADYNENEGRKQDGVIFFRKP